MRPIELLSVWGYSCTKIKNASMNLGVIESESCIQPSVCMPAWILCMGTCGPGIPLTWPLMFTSSFPPSLCFYPCSTRKQNYMMNFARQTGVRHYYNRKKRALLQRAWSQQYRDSASAAHVLTLWTTYYPVPFRRGFQSALDFCCPNSPNTIPKHKPVSFASAHQGRSSYAGSVGMKEDRSEAAILHFIHGRSGFPGYLLIVDVVPLLLLLSISNNSPCGLPAHHSQFLLFLILLPHCERDVTAELTSWLESCPLFRWATEERTTALSPTSIPGERLLQWCWSWRGIMVMEI